MLRKLTKLALVAVLGGAALLLTQAGSTHAQDKEKLTVKQIMGVGHKGANALFGKVQTAIKAKKWDEAAAPAKELAENASLFPKTVPAKDAKKTWEKLAAKYAGDTKALADAVEKKDEAAAKKAAGAIQGSCKTCHDNHKGK